MTKVLAVVDGPVQPRLVTALAGAVADVMGAEVETLPLQGGATS